jgi:hypothetical protein
MNHGLPSAAVRLLSGQACVLTPSLIYEIYGPVRMTGPGKRSNSVYDKTNIELFASRGGIFCGHLAIIVGTWASDEKARLASRVCRM